MGLGLRGLNSKMTVPENREIHTSPYFFVLEKCGRYTY
jgi:hypothetical protein